MSPIYYKVPLLKLCVCENKDKLILEKKKIRKICGTIFSNSILLNPHFRNFASLTFSIPRVHDIGDLLEMEGVRFESIIDKTVSEERSGEDRASNGYPST